MMADEGRAPVSDSEFAAALEALNPQLPLAVAVSGGADSMALLLLASRWAGNKGSALLALSVDHGLRESAAAELAQVAAWCGMLGITHRILPWHGIKPVSDIQAAARRARYALLTEACEAHHITTLLLGHHLEDQAETFLLRLARGSGVDGLSSMPTARAMNGVRMLRPLLGFPKDRLKATLRHSGQDWIEDPSNRDRRFARVRVRGMLDDLREEGLTPARLAGTAQRMQRVRDALDAATKTLIGNSVQWDKAGFVYLTLSSLLAAPDEITLRALAKLLMAVAGQDYPPRLVRLEALLAWLRQMPEAGGRTLSGCRILPAKGRLVIARELAAMGPERPILPGESALWDSRFRVQLSLEASDGGIVRAVGSAGLQQVRKSMPDPVLPSLVCQATPGLWQGPKLMAAPLLGFASPDSAINLTHFAARFTPHGLSPVF